MDDLKLLPILPRTEQAYYACVRQLSEFYDKSPDPVTPEEIRQYCIYLKTEKKLARQTSTQVICAIKMFWQKACVLAFGHCCESQIRGPKTEVVFANTLTIFPRRKAVVAEFNSQ